MPRSSAKRRPAGPAELRRPSHRETPFLAISRRAARVLISARATASFPFTCPSVADLPVFGVPRALFLADRAERVSSLLFLTGKRGGSSASMLGIEVFVPNQATATARALQPELVGRLAKFFPQATPVGIPVMLSRSEGTGKEKLP